jgi:hypothetical protein
VARRSTGQRIAGVTECRHQFRTPPDVDSATAAKLFLDRTNVGGSISADIDET